MVITPKWKLVKIVNIRPLLWRGEEGAGRYLDHNATGLGDRMARGMPLGGLGSIGALGWGVLPGQLLCNVAHGEGGSCTCNQLSPHQCMMNWARLTLCLNTFGSMELSRECCAGICTDAAAPLQASHVEAKCNTDECDCIGLLH